MIRAAPSATAPAAATREATSHHRASGSEPSDAGIRARDSRGSPATTGSAGVVAAARSACPLRSGIASCVDGEAVRAVGIGAADDAPSASPETGAVRRSSPPPRGEAERRGDGSRRAETRRVPRDPVDARATTSRPPADASPVLVGAGAAAASDEATGSAARAGSAAVPAGATAAAGCGLSTATGGAVGCAGAVTAGGCTAGGATGATAAGDGAVAAGGAETGRCGRKRSGST